MPCHAMVMLIFSWLRPYGIRSGSSTFTMFRDEMAPCDRPENSAIDLVRQALCVRSLLRARGLKHGTLVVVCSDFQLAGVSLVFNRLLHTSNAKITLEYIAAPTPKAEAPSNA